jgi:hypothetical protein
MGLGQNKRERGITTRSARDLDEECQTRCYCVWGSTPQSVGVRVESRENECRRTIEKGQVRIARVGEAKHSISRIRELAGKDG